MESKPDREEDGEEKWKEAEESRRRAGRSPNRPEEAGEGEKRKTERERMCGPERANGKRGARWGKETNRG